MSELLYEVLEIGADARSAYGILVKKQRDGLWQPVAAAAPLSDDRAEIAQLADRCNTLQLSPVHFMDVATDFLRQPPEPH